MLADRVDAANIFKKNTRRKIGIGDFAFAGNTSITSVIIPSGRVRIDNSAFMGCPAISSASQTAIREQGYRGSF
ncbi:hypothetical protein FACS189479_00140 [Spirochaetia bacterium]|nr:hypothetical protein FACS189479_00140 [Spirochaetia bacterium]